MSVDKTLVNQPSAATDTNFDLWLLDQTKFKLIGTKVDGNTTTSDYVYADGEPAFRVILRVLTTVDGPKVLPFPMRRTTLKLLVPQIWTDTETSVVTAGPTCEFWGGFAVPADESVSVAVQSKWLNATMGMYYPSYASGAGNTATLTALAFRYTDIL